MENVRFPFLKVVATLFICCPLMVTSCHQASSSSEEEHEHHHEDGEIHISSLQATRLAIEVDTVRYGTFRPVLHTGGRLVSDNSSEVTIVAPTGGVVTSVLKQTAGALLGGGTQIASIAPKDESGNSAYSAAYSSYVLRKKELDRADSLLKDQVISQKRYDEIKHQYDLSKNALTVCAGENISVKTPQGGYLKSLKVSNHQYVSLGQVLAVVASSNKLRLEAEVPECGYSILSSIRTANFKTSYEDSVYALSRLNGKLLSYGKSSNESSFVPITFELDNAGNLLADSYVEVYLLGEEETNVLSIPLSSVTEEQGQNFVYLQETEEHYVKVPVRLGENDGLRVRVTDGLKGGELLVVKGAFLVKLASMSSAIPEGHSHNH